MWRTSVITLFPPEYDDLPGPGPCHGSLGICVFLAEADFSSLTSRPSEPTARMMGMGDMEHLVYNQTCCFGHIIQCAHSSGIQSNSNAKQPIQHINLLHSVSRKWPFLLSLGSRPRITPTGLLPSLVQVCLVVELVQDSHSFSGSLKWKSNRCS